MAGPKIKPTELIGQSEKCIKNGKINEAFELLKRAGEAHYANAYLMIAELFLTEKFTPELFSEKTDNPNHNVEKAIIYLKHAFKTASKDGQFHNKVNALLITKDAKETQAKLAQDTLAKLKAIHAKNYTSKYNQNLNSFSKHKLTKSRLELLIESYINGNNNALKKIQDCLTDLMSNEIISAELLQFIYQQGQNFSTKQSPREKTLGFILLVTIYKKVTDAAQLNPPKTLLDSYLTTSNKNPISYNRAQVNDKLLELMRVISRDHTTDYIEIILCWIVSENIQDIEVNANLESFITDSNISDARLLNLCFKLAHFFFMNNSYEKACFYYEKGFAINLALTKEYEKDQQGLRATYTHLGRLADIEIFNARVSQFGNGEPLLKQANDLNPIYPPKTLEDLQNFKIAIELLKQAALLKNTDALIVLNRFVELNAPEAILAKAEVFTKVGIHKKNAVLASNSFFYPSKNYPQSLYDSVKNAYIRAIKNERIGINYDYAILRYQGEIFEKNLFVARKHFKIACERNDYRAYIIYAYMCFYGEGGDVNIEEAQRMLETVNFNVVTFQNDDEKNNLVQAAYILANIYYLHYLYAYHHNNTQECQPNLTRARTLLDFTLMHGDENTKDKSILMLEILNNAEKLLTTSSTPRISSAQEINFFDSQELLRATMEDQYQDAMNDTNIRSKYTKLKLIAANSQHLHNIDAIEILYQYYHEKPNGVLNLITELCNELYRHDLSSSYCQMLRNLIVRLAPIFDGYDKIKFLSFLRQEEAQKEAFFEDDLSEDSDEEKNELFAHADPHLQSEWVRADELSTKISGIALKKLQELDDVVEDKEFERRQMDNIRSLFTSVATLQPERRTNDKTILDDLATLNHHNARGDITTALQLITTKFVYAQTRGIHFQKSLWNTEMRRSYHSAAKDPQSAILDAPLYSSAVYELSGITDFNDRSELTKMKLDIAARFLHWQMQKFSNLPMLDDKNLPEELKNKIAYRQFINRMYQLQQIYTNDYDLFATFLRFEQTLDDHCFVSEKNPFVSTGDIQSWHSLRYAFGLKEYAGHDVIDPKYLVNRITHSHTGVVFLTIHPVSDLARKDANHVISLNNLGEIEVPEHCNAEREYSVYSSIPSDRVKHFQAAKYPSFDHKKYLKIMLHRYGLTEDLYLEFQKAIANSKPHLVKRSLVVRLLGEYISAYHTLYLQRKAQTFASENSYVLVYRDKYGNFSLQPTSDISPTPHGSNDHELLRRAHTLDMRKTRRQTRFGMFDQHLSQLDTTMDDDVDVTAGSALKKQRIK